MQAPYGRMVETPQREKTHIEPKQNQREVHLAIQATLPKVKPMKEGSMVVCKSSGKNCEYHQDYCHTMVESLARIIEELGVVEGATPLPSNLQNKATSLGAPQIGSVKVKHVENVWVIFGGEATRRDNQHEKQ